jgi:DNA invertase Pin-like site-specific DNA recombinase
MTTVAAIYTRISQDQTGQAVGVGNQLEKCRAFIKSKGWTEGKLYSDNDISATSGKVRPDFERLLQDAPPVVVAWEQSRLSRNPLDTLRIKDAGITGYLTDGGKLDFTSADAELMTMIRSHMDAAEGRKKAERQKPQPR